MITACGKAKKAPVTNSSLPSNAEFLLKKKDKYLIFEVKTAMPLLKQASFQNREGTQKVWKNMDMVLSR